MRVNTKSRKAAIKPSPIVPLQREQFQYLDQLGIVLPQLMLGIRVSNRELSGDVEARSYRFKSDRPWSKIVHQTAGLRCHQHYYHGLLLTPLSLTVSDGMRALNSAWYDTSFSAMDGDLDRVNEYRGQVQRWLKADCKVSYQTLEEAHFPIDLQYLSRLVAEALPKDLDEMIEWRDGWDRAMGCLGRYSLVILGQNSD